MRQQWCPGRFSSPPQKWPGNEASSVQERWRYRLRVTSPLLVYCVIANAYTLLRKMSETSVKMKKDVGDTVPKTVKQEGTAR